MALRIPRPDTLVALAVATAGKAVSTATTIASVPGRLLRLIDQGEVLMVRIAAVVDAAEKTVDDVRTATASAATVAEEAARTSATAGRLVDQVAETSEAARALVTQIGPDVHELVGVTREVQQAIVSIPGFGMLRRRGEDRTREQDAIPAPPADRQ
jgi:ABC-type transporter Mla subunit MlaD